MELLAVGAKRGDAGIEKRTPIEVKNVGEELSILIPDHNGGSRWYKFALKPGPAPAKAELAVALDPAAKTAQIVKAHRNNLIVVSGKNGSGSGFVARYGTGTFLFTNTHVAAGENGTGFKTLEGTAVQTGAASSAAGHDILLLQAPASSQPLEIMNGVEENTAVGDDVVVLGNAEGAGAINSITGKIVGFGPQLLEIDATFHPGHRGSPIVHLKTGQVIGVATDLTVRKYDNATKEAAKEPVVRRFGYRLDSVRKWQPVNWPVFSAEAAEMEAIEKLTVDLVSLLRDLTKDRKIDRNTHANPALTKHIDAWLEAKEKGLNPKDAEAADRSLLSFLKIACQNDLTAARPRLTYDYFQRLLVEQEKERAQIADAFAGLLREIR